MKQEASKKRDGGVQSEAESRGGEDERERLGPVWGSEFEEEVDVCDLQYFGLIQEPAVMVYSFAHAKISILDELRPQFIVMYDPHVSVAR